MCYIISNISKCSSNNIGNLLRFNGWYMLNNSLVSYDWLIFSFMFNLLIIGVRYLNWLIICMLNCLVISEGFCNFNWVSDCSILCIDILSIIRDLFVSDNWLIISILFLNGYIFNPCFWLRSPKGLFNRLSIHYLV